MRWKIKSREIGDIYNIGGDNELPTVEVAKEIIRALNLEDYIDSLITFVLDHALNTLRYTINSFKLHAFGWTEDTKWEGGQKKTAKWYTENTCRYGNIDLALVVHPRQGLKKRGRCDKGV